MNILNSAAEKCIHPPERDSDMILYIKQLQSVLIEAYTIFLQDVLDKDQEIKDCIGTDLEFIITFLLSAAHNDY